MIKLLRGDFARLFQSRVFLICTTLMFGFAITIASVMNLSADFNRPTDSIMFCNTQFLGIVIAVFVGTFVGTDYSNGTIRNKLMAHSRISVYVSNLILCITAALIIHFAWLLVFLLFEAIGLTGTFEMTDENIMLSILVSILGVTALTSIFLLICMLITSKSTALTTVLILSFIMLYTSITIVEEGGNSPTLSEFLPDYQFVRLNSLVLSSSWGYYINMPDNFNMFPLFSLLIVTLTTTVGIYIFQKKDFK